MTSSPVVSAALWQALSITSRLTRAIWICFIVGPISSPFAKLVMTRTARAEIGLGIQIK